MVSLASSQKHPLGGFCIHFFTTLFWSLCTSSYPLNSFHILAKERIYHWLTGSHQYYYRYTALISLFLIVQHVQKRAFSWRKSQVRQGASKLSKVAAEGQVIEDVGYLHLHRENRKFQLENQMVSSFPFGNLQKIWAVICRDAIFLLLLACSADFDILRSGSFTHHVKFLPRKGSRGGIIVVARSYMLFLIFFSQVIFIFPLFQLR